MTGDQYHVHYTLFGDTNTHTELNGPWGTWRDAKVIRDAKFYGFKDVQSCWIMVTNSVYSLAPKKYGHTLRRGKGMKYDSDVGAYTSRQRRGQRKRAGD